MDILQEIANNVAGPGGSRKVRNQALAALREAMGVTGGRTRTVAAKRGGGAKARPRASNRGKREREER